MLDTANLDCECMKHYTKIIKSLNDIEIMTKIEMFIRYYIYCKDKEIYFKPYDKIENDKIRITYYLN